MKLRKGIVAMGTLALVLAVGIAYRAQGASGGKTWSVKADYIEACSCHLFCACYFYPHPEGGMRCEFNNAIKMVEGHVGDVKVDGLKVWLSGDLGGDFSKGEMKSAVITFEPQTTDKQKEALKFLIGKIYPVKWKSVAVDIAPIKWEKTGMNGHAVLGAGKGQGEVTLTGVKDADGKQTVINNLKYWGAQKNTGFYLAKSKHRYKGHGHDYKYDDHNGFFIHIESSGTT
jgi:hypothetical protein